MVEFNKSGDSYSEIRNFKGYTVDNIEGCCIIKIICLDGSVSTYKCTTPKEKNGPENSNNL